jgi:hypothetical protein
LGRFPPVRRAAGDGGGLEAEGKMGEAKVNLALRAVRRKSSIGASESESLASRRGDVAVF